MNRSFLYGIVVASSTWCFSLYLYWLLVQQHPSDTLSSTINSLPQPLKDEHFRSQQQIELGSKIEHYRNSVNDYDKPSRKINWSDKTHINDKSFILDKLQKLKKEKKFRKISQKLIDELKPVETDNSTGKLEIMEVLWGVCFMEFW